MKRLLLSVVALAVAFGALLAVPGAAGAASSRKLPSFELRDLEDRELRLTDDRFKNKALLVTAFTTWNESSREQARQVEAFAKAHPEVEVIAFVVNSLAEARDFVKQEGLTYPCYKCDAVSRVAYSFNRLFELKKGKTLASLNRIPFVILTDKARNVQYANLGPTDEKNLSAEYAKIK